MAVLALILFEAFAVWRAERRTAEVLALASKGELQLSDLSPERRTILLAVEDPAFYQHRGVDFSTPGQGRTTMTQSLVKHFYFDDFHKGFPKIEQSLIARFVFDPALSKDGQLHAFLNHARFGNVAGRPVIGFADAARVYFHRPFESLNERQFLSLVAMLMAPNALDPLEHARANAERVERIERMLGGKCAPSSLTDVTYDKCESA